jgi:hypothetical protein
LPAGKEPGQFTYAFFIGEFSGIFFVGKFIFKRAAGSILFKNRLYFNQWHRVRSLWGLNGYQQTRRIIIKQNIDDLTGSYGDDITISCTTPMILNFLPQSIVSPTACLKFMKRAAVSFTIMLDESPTCCVQNRGLQLIFHWATLPNSGLRLS